MSLQNSVQSKDSIHQDFKVVKKNISYTSGTELSQAEAQQDLINFISNIGCGIQQSHCIQVLK